MTTLRAFETILIATLGSNWPMKNELFIFAQTGNAPMPSYWPLIYPAAHLASLLVISIWVYRKYHQRLDDFISKRRSRRVTLYFIASILGICASALMDWIDFSDISSGIIVSRDRFLMPFLWWTGLGTFWCGILIFYNSDNWEVRLETEEAKAREADARHSIAHRDFLFVIAIGKSLVFAAEKRFKQLREIFQDLQGASPLDLGLPTFLAKLLSQDQMQLLVEMIHASFQRWHVPDELLANKTLRVAFYEEREGYMAVLKSTDGQAPDCIQTPHKENREKFRVNHASPDNFTIACTLQNDVLIYDDAVEADQNPNKAFRFYDSEEKKIICSIAGFQILEGQIPSAPRRVIVIDSNVPNFFVATRDKTVLTYLQAVVSPVFSIENKLMRIAEMTAETATGKPVMDLVVGPESKLPIIPGKGRSPIFLNEKGDPPPLPS